MLKVFRGARIALIEIVAIGQQFSDGDLPGAFIFDALAEPSYAFSEFLELHRL